MDWHSMTNRDVLEHFHSDPTKGLSFHEVHHYQEKYGKNILKEKKQKSLLRKFMEQFSDFMVIILLIAAAVSFITSYMDGSGDILDPIIILVIVIVNAITGVIQESKAEKAINALRKMSAPTTKVMRGGKQLELDSGELVPGDIIILDTGDLVPADARLLDATNLKTDESALTGESLPVDKDASRTCESGALVGDRKNMIFSASVVTCGHCKAVVTETGMNTEVGKIAGMINDGEAAQTPLQNKLEQIGKMLGIGAMAICAIIFVMGLIQKIPPLDMFMISVSLAVAAIPEGLPAIVTIVLAIGVQRMVKKHAIVRRLPAVETLGSATVICSDKTGTLTQNKMTVMETASSQGTVTMDSREGKEILTLAALCNNSVLHGRKPDWTAQGFPTETALVIAAAQHGLIKTQLDFEYKRLKELPFDSSRKLMTTIHQLKSGGYRVITKGAPDILIRKTAAYTTGNGSAAMTDGKRAEIEHINAAMAGKAMRVIAVAYRDIANLPSDPATAERDLIFCGLLGMQDPPRPQAKEAVRLCKGAGIKPVMITGDHVLTASAIAKELGILEHGDKAMTGAELDRIPEEELTKAIRGTTVFARVTPEHKVRIVKAFQSAGEVVAMTGDGVNDAPALKTADIGCAMGQGGTEVAKAASDMILTDDNFSTIVGAVREGRGIYENIKKAAHFLISSNIGEIITIFTASLLRLPTPLLPIQLLWVNLVTDSLPAMALGVEPVEEDIMERKPVSPKEHLFSGGRGIEIALEGALIGALALLAFTVGRIWFNIAAARTMTFAVLSLSQLVHAFNMRSSHSLFHIGFTSNKKMVFSFLVCLALQVGVIMYEPLSVIFKTTPLGFLEWAIVTGLALVPFFAVELEKRISAKSKSRKEKKNRQNFSLKKSGI